MLFQPPYCPEVNPIERVGEYNKYRLRSEAMPLAEGVPQRVGLSLWFSNLDDVREKVAYILNSLDRDIIISLTNWDYFNHALSF